MDTSFDQSIESILPLRNDAVKVRFLQIEMETTPHSTFREFLMKFKEPTNETVAEERAYFGGSEHVLYEI